MLEFEKNVRAYGKTKKVSFTLFSYVEAHKVQQKIAEL